MQDESTGNSPSNDTDVRVDKVERKIRLLSVRLQRNERAFAAMAALFKEAVIAIYKCSEALGPHAESIMEKVSSFMPSVGDDEK
jgi:hypothetical protein